MPTARKDAPPTPDPKAPDAWVSLNEAARLLGVTRYSVLQLALKGAVASDRRGDWTFISRASIDAYLADAGR